MRARGLTAVIHFQTPHGAGVSVFATFAAHDAPTEQRDPFTILGETGTIRLDGAELSIAGSHDERIVFDQPQGLYRLICRDDHPFRPCSA